AVDRVEIRVDVALREVERGLARPAQRAPVAGEREEPADEELPAASVLSAAGGGTGSERDQERDDREDGGELFHVAKDSRSGGLAQVERLLRWSGDPHED